MPFGIWHALAQLAELLPHPPVTRNQVELMRHDNVVSAQMPSFGELEISPQSVEDIVPALLRNG